MDRLSGEVSRFGVSINEDSSEHMVLEQAAINALKSNLRGPVFLPGDEGYNQARQIWNAMIDKRPALIARCSGVADIVAAIQFAQANHLLLAVRGGGHNIAGKALCDGGLVIDLTMMRSVHVDPKTRRARAQPGANWGDFDRETQLFGLATTGGLVSTTGIAGLTLGGGFGWLSRKYGLACDNLVSVDMVTAEGQFVTASEVENADLFWGIRGGGGNFGIVTSFEYRLHPAGPQMMAGMILYPMEKAAEVLRFYREYTATAPDELTAMAILRLAPPVPFLPAEIHGKPVVGIVVCHAGPIAEGESAVRPLKELGTPLVDLIAPKPYTVHQTLLDATQPPGRQYYWKSEYLSVIGDDAIETSIAYAWHITSPQSLVIFFPFGGAVSRVGANDSAYGFREAGYILTIASSWLDPNESDRHIDWTRQLWRAIQPFSTGGGYVNFLTEEEGEARVRAAYGPANYERLVELKNKYDPANFFRCNQNIKPTVQP